MPVMSKAKKIPRPPIRGTEAVWNFWGPDKSESADQRL